MGKSSNQQRQQSSQWDDFGRDQHRQSSCLFGIVLLRELRLDVPLVDLTAAVDRLYASSDEALRKMFNSADPATAAWLERQSHG